LFILMCVKQNGGGDGGMRDFEQLKVNWKWHQKLNNVSESRMQWPIELTTGLYINYQLDALIIIYS